MRICSPQLGLNPNSILGGEVFDREILLGLAQKGIEIEIILPKDKPYDQNIKNWNITNVAIKHFPAIMANLIFIPYLFRIYSKRPFDILRLHSPRYLGLGAIIFKLFKSKTKLVATYHQFKESNFGPFSKIVNNFWDHIICDSQNVKNRLVKSYKLLPSKISVVHNGVPKYLRPAAKDKKLLEKLKLEGKTVLLFMGLFIERKNPLFLLDLLVKLCESKPEVVLIFWGEGPLKTQIIKRAKELKMEDNIRIIDPIFGPEKNEIHNLADIFVHPAVNEGFALAPLEAMACAKPILMNKGHSAKEAVDNNVNGFICRTNDIEDWTKNIKNLISNKNLRERMGSASLRKAKNEFQWKLAVEKHIQVFNSII